MKKILLLGPPGAGKGTVADWLVQNYQFIHLSTGQIFRSLSEEDSALSEQVRELHSQGKLIPDHLTNQIVQAKLVKLAQTHPDANLVLDGYPRTIGQAQFLHDNFQIDQVVLLNCPESEIMDRLTNRLVCKAHDHVFHKIHHPPKVPNICDIDHSPLYQRRDDQRAVILKRLKIYESVTKPLIDYYQQQNLLAIIDTNGPLANTTKSLKAILNIK